MGYLRGRPVVTGSRSPCRRRRIPDGSTITGPSYEYIVFDNDTTTSSTLAYPAATLDKSQAALTVRAHLTDAPVPVPAAGWEYTSSDGTAIRLLPAGTRFQQSAIYEFTYTAKNPVVAGLGPGGDA